MAYCLQIKTGIFEKMINATSNKLYMLDFITINAFFISYESTDIAYTLTCIGCILAGMTARIIILIKRATDDMPLTKKTVTLHVLAAFCICFVSYFGWHQGLNQVWPFRLFGLPLYLAMSSFASMYVIDALDKISQISSKITVKSVGTYLYNKFIRDERGGEIK